MDFFLFVFIELCFLFKNLTFVLRTSLVFVFGLHFWANGKKIKDFEIRF